MARMEQILRDFGSVDAYKAYILDMKQQKE